MQKTATSSSSDGETESSQSSDLSDLPSDSDDIITTACYLMTIHPCQVWLYQQHLVLNIIFFFKCQLKHKAKHRDTTDNSSDSETETEKPKKKVKKPSKMKVPKAKRKKSYTPLLPSTPKTPPKCSQSPPEMQDNPKAVNFDPTKIPLVKTAKRVSVSEEQWVQLMEYVQ